MSALIPTAVSAITRGGPKRQYKWNRRAQQDNLEIMKQLQAEQRAYDSPGAQMQRFIEAGLNPHLIYGGGSGSAGSAFPIDVPQAQAPNASYPDVGQGFLQAQMTMASTQRTQAQTVLDQIKTQATEVQTRIASANPMLNPNVANMVADAMLQTAWEKSVSSRAMTTIYSDRGDSWTYAERKVKADVEALEKRLGLYDQDLAIKNKIFESKEFENALKKIQVEWMRDGDITPEHIRQGFMMLFQTMMR